MTGTTSDGATSLRRAGPADAAEIAELLIRAHARAAADSSVPAAVHPDAEVRAWVAAVVVPERKVWLGVAGAGTVVAVMVLDGGWLDQLYVDPDQTGRGIGASSSSTPSAAGPTGSSCGPSSPPSGRSRSTSAPGSRSWRRPTVRATRRGNPTCASPGLGPSR